jgi:hypothetical protein
MTSRKRDYYGFLLQRHFVYGSHSGVEYATNGNIKNGKMLIYTNSGNGWISRSVDGKTHEIAKLVNSKYGVVIAEKNDAYKGSMRELQDANAWKEKTYGRELGIKTRPYDGKFIDSRYRCFVASRREANTI